MTLSGLSLTQRLLLPISFVLFVGGVAQSYMELRQGGDAAQHRIEQDAVELLETLTPLVAEQALIGDYATLRELLEHQAGLRDNLLRMSWQSHGGEAITVPGQAVINSAPLWFQRLLDLSDVQSRREVGLGGTSYGFLVVEFSPASVVGRLWHEFFAHTTVLLSTVLIILILTTVLLRVNLAAVHRLAAAADRVRAGDLTVRLPRVGAPELRNATDAFNNMVVTLEMLIKEEAEGRRRLDEQLHFTKHLIEVLPNPVFYTDADGRMLGVNAAWEEFFRLSREQVVGSLLANLQWPEAAASESAQRYNRDLLVRPGLQTYETSHIGPDGNPHSLIYAKATFTRPDGAPAGLIGVINDITELKVAAEQARVALVDKVRAESASEAKSAFLANMSHEIRTPLTAVIGFAESLLEPDTTMQERVEAVNIIIRAGKHLQRLITDILDLSKIEAGRITVEPLPVPLVALVEDMRAFASLQAETRGLTFKIEYEGYLPAEITTDPLRLRQVLINLIGNAIKFTETGGVTLRVSCDRPAQLMKFEVIDTGIGLTPEQQKQLFQPFSQGDAGIARRFGGTGLGLHLSLRFAQLLGGSITLTSEAGRGSHFTVTVATGDLSQAQMTWGVHGGGDSARPAKAVSGRFSGRVLLAEDNADNQRLISYHLRKLGIEPEIVADGQMAAARAMAQPFDLVLMDMQMPVMDGVEATRKLRSDGYTAPIVAITANAMRQDVEECIQAGCDGFLAKPIDKEKFLACVANYLTPVAGDSEPGDDTPIVSNLLEKEPELAGLVMRFASELPDTVQAILPLVSNKDWMELKRRIHDLKSVAGGYGFPSVATLTSRIDFALAAQDYVAVERFAPELRALAERIQRGVAAKPAHDKAEYLI